MRTLQTRIGDPPDLAAIRAWLPLPATACKRAFILPLLLLTGTCLFGCRTPIPEGTSSESFDAQKVAKLSHEAYQVAYDATFWARRDLRFAAFQPTALDYEAVAYLGEIRRHVPWVARKVEKNPQSPRASSAKAYDVVAYDAMMLRSRYQPNSFKPSTNAKVKYLLGLLDQIAPYYVQISPPEAINGQSSAASLGAGK